jgi:outer membrane protein TolC
LIRNYKGKLDRLQYDLAAYTIDVTEMQAMENQEKFLFDIGNKFLDWVLYFQQRKIAEERLELARRQLEQSEAKFEANLVDKVDVLRSEDAVRKARQNLVLIESRITAQKAELAVLAKNQSITDKEPAYDLFQLKDLPSIDMAYNDALIRSRMVNTLKVRQDQLEENLEGFKEIGEPTLDLGLGAGLKGGDRQFGESIVLDKPDFMASLLFTKPLGNTSAEADITRTELQIKQNRYQIEKTSLDLESSITNILIQLKELESVLRLNREEIDSANLRTEEETKLYNQGRSDLAFVIQSQDNVQNARLLYAENAANYHKLYLRYRELTDQILLTKGSD